MDISSSYFYVFSNYTAKWHKLHKTQPS
jgi:hypothetical protein